MIFSLERIALALFAFALTLIAGALVFASPILIDENPTREKAQPVIQAFNCHEAIERAGEQRFRVIFVLDMRPTSFIVESGTVTSKELGTCGANSPHSSFNAMNGSFDIHEFTAGGSLCNERDGSVKFTAYYDRRAGLSRFASLVVKGVPYLCEL